MSIIEVLHNFTSNNSISIDSLAVPSVAAIPDCSALKITPDPSEPSSSDEDIELVGNQKMMTHLNGSVQNNNNTPHNNNHLNHHHNNHVKSHHNHLNNHNNSSVIKTSAIVSSEKHFPHKMVPLTNQCFVNPAGSSPSNISKIRKVLSFESDQKGPQTDHSRSEPPTPRLSISPSEEWIQCSGHEGGFLPSKEGRIWKKVSPSKDDFEVQSYRELMKEERMREFFPTFYSSVSAKNLEGDRSDYIEIEDLLHLFRHQVSSSKSFRSKSYPSTPVRISALSPASPSLHVMDIKMGTRTFLEKEASSPTQRADLYEKMVKIDPSEPTIEELKNKSVTKLRYMTFRESLSSSSNLGFRIEGVQPPSSVKDEDSIEPLEFQKIKEVKEVEMVLRKFLRRKKNLQSQLVQRLKDLREEFEKSKFFSSHEVIGSSLLLIHDGSQRLGVWMIDFAKSLPLPSGVSIDHRTPWKLGNHEDGYLYGLDNLIDITSNL